MNLQNLLIEAIRRSTDHVFSTMVGTSLPPGESSIEKETPESAGVVSFIGLAGPWAGIGTFICSASQACRICSLMLMSEMDAVNEDVLDVIAELTNMIVGNVKNELERELGPLGLSIPTVVYGRNFRTKSAHMTEWVVVRFPFEGDQLVVKLCLAPNERGHHLGAHVQGQPCVLEV